MKTIVEYYCKACKTDTIMHVTGPVRHLNIYWVKCTKCNNTWRVPVDMLESLAKENV